jgi:hypothetical protein
MAQTSRIDTGRPSHRSHSQANSIPCPFSCDHLLQIRIGARGRWDNPIHVLNRARELHPHSSEQAPTAPDGFMYRSILGRIHA